jgi:hypothetical protein
MSPGGLLLVSQVHVHGWGLESRNTVAGSNAEYGWPCSEEEVCCI